MKTLLNLAVIATAGLTLTACETGLGNFDDAPPYSQNRTATHTQAPKPEPAPAPAPEPAPVVEAPVCEPCEDCGPLRTRIASLEGELAACREASNRVRDAYQDELKK